MSDNVQFNTREEGPDFIGVGVQKSGTTWVADILEQHPQVLMRKKEISFYTHHFHRGYKWYHNWFRDKNGKVAGEITVSYLLLPRPDPSHKEFYPKWNPRRKLRFWESQPSARDELAAHYPDLKVFSVFRNPADRAWSHYWFWRNRKERMGKKIVPFEQFFADDGRWVRTHGYYADHLAHWLEAFPEMKIFFHDDLKADPSGFAREVFRFIGVDEDFTPVLHKKVNEGRYQQMPQETRAMVIDTYRDQIPRFAEMTGRDLSGWLEVE